MEYKKFVFHMFNSLHVLISLSSLNNTVSIHWLSQQHTLSQGLVWSQIHVFYLDSRILLTIAVFQVYNSDCVLKGHAFDICLMRHIRQWGPALPQKRVLGVEWCTLSGHTVSSSASHLTKCLLWHIEQE